MDLTLTDEQRQLRASYEELFERECPITEVRRAEAEEGWSPRLWKRLADAGITELGMPTARGGQGAELLDCTFVAEAAGRHLAPVPLIDAIAAGRLLGRLESIPAEVDGIVSQTTIAVSPEPIGAETCRLVPWGAAAQSLVAYDDRRVLIVRRHDAVSRRPEMSGGAVADWKLDDDTVRTTTIATGSEARQQQDLLAADLAALSAAWLVGLAASALDLAVAYTSERRAFDVPVASFQSVAHRLADLATAIDGARMLAQEAAWTIDHDHDRGLSLAGMAVTFAAATALEAATSCLHFHGGYGFMLEYDPQLYYRRAAAHALLYRVARHTDALVDALSVDGGN